MNETEHQSLDGGTHPDEWRTGATCDECKDQYEMNKLTKRNPTPGFNLAWLKNSNAVGQTANEMVKEIYDGARESGSDIRKVGESAKVRKERNDRLRAERDST